MDIICLQLIFRLVYCSKYTCLLFNLNCNRNCKCTESINTSYYGKSLLLIPCMYQAIYLIFNIDRIQYKFELYRFSK